MALVPVKKMERNTPPASSTAIIAEETAIAWITLNAARSIGLEDQTGSLEVGKRADVVIWSANPFSIYALADQVFIDGARVWDRDDPAYQARSDFELGQPGQEIR